MADTARTLITEYLVLWHNVSQPDLALMVGTLCRNVGAQGVGDGPETGRLGVRCQGEEP